MAGIFVISLNPKSDIMPDYQNISLTDVIEDAIDIEVLIENIKIKYGVAKPITRQLIVEVGLCLPKIYDELRKLGYPVPPKI